jgi:hypothetical protein
LMRKFISSFGGFSVKAFTNRDFVGVRIWLTPPLPVPPYRHPARQSAVHHRARAAAMPWPHPTARAHPDVAFFRRRQDHWHCLWVDRFNDRVRSRGQEAIDQMRAGDRLRLGATVAFELGPEATKGEQRSNVLLFGLRVRLRRIFSRQRLSGLSQACQWGEVALRSSAVFFMSGPPVPGGGGCVVAYGRDACGCAVDCGDGSIGTGLRVEAEVGPGGGAEILDRRF